MEDRRPHSQRRHDASTSSFTPQLRQQSHRPANASTTAEMPTGVSKLKSSLRSVKRLLNKEDLAPNVKVENERRLVALEAQLAEAQRNETERNNASRYHKVKFFERQKLTRRIKQSLTAVERATDDDERATAQALLDQYRVDLNYVLHFPKDQKYIGLFPNNVWVPHSGTDTSADSTPETTKRRASLRVEISQLMAKGIYSAEPEKDKSADRTESLPRKRKEVLAGAPSDTKKSKDSKPKRPPMPDDFFEY
ncbi:uncharacterized protein L969DRAFT_87218 [Mixia osmundae IAM 14324]|uniref:rRNA-processing protein EFG1 n=1 Tax=Mixia osmundae (strain CBS 9802 / IAM 14324 / JCM 22182 / KY 12970) TaxID=764103 RepID=G7DZQ6_MIXOS|nr:uncharacterized protein L969DRAFT_87218 [Mixia osmundae IAM 14324]KEI39275.1 hypothetical protein L969DRAFT_87218 [Mixia osmundae IAM 14324]GAA96066.1 hypothetical protein E5Q_02727 [Mixia osmundae IAM 14324]